VAGGDWRLAEGSQYNPAPVDNASKYERPKGNTMDSPAGKLQGKVVVIVGGTTGLGLSAAKACAAEGARLVLVGRSAESAKKAVSELEKGALQERAAMLVADAVLPATAEEAVKMAISQFGRFDALYHVAGGSGRSFGDGPLHEITDQAVPRTLELNLQSAIYSNRAAVRALMAQGGGGVVLNMGSVLACSPSPRYFATHVYAAAKSALVGLTKSCAAYYAPHNIRFHLLAPALVETPMSVRAARNDDIQQFIRTKQPLEGGRIGRADDLDAAVVFLLSDGSRYMTGQVLAVDGGWSVSEGGNRDD